MQDESEVRAVSVFGLGVGINKVVFLEHIDYLVEVLIIASVFSCLNMNLIVHLALFT